MTTTAEWLEDHDNDRPETGTVNAELTIADLAYHARTHARRVADRTALDLARDQLIAEATEWHARRAVAIDDKINYHASVLTAHAQRAYDDSNGKTKSVELPNGTRIQRNAGRLSVQILDEPLAVEWCRTELPDAIVAHPDTIDKTKVVAALAGKAKDTTEPGAHPAVTPEGTIAAGIVIVRGEPTIKVKPPTGIVDDEPLEP